MQECCYCNLRRRFVRTLSKWMKVSAMLCFFAFVACQHKGGQSDGTDGAGIDSLETTGEAKSLLSEDCSISQPALDREIYICIDGSHDDRVSVVVHSVKTDRRDSIMTEIKARPMRLLEGRMADEVFIFSIDGNGAYGWLTKVDIKKRLCKSVELGMGASDIRRTQDGFVVERFSEPSWNEDHVYREWTEVWDFNMENEN